jgi:uncharacterized membrane protein (DUF4010 family)
MTNQEQAWLAMGETLLIGLIVGVERESDQGERHAGLRDFIGIALAGGICGLLGQAWVTAAALAALTAMIVIFRLQTPDRTGITTEIVAVTTFLLCLLTTTAQIAWGSELAIALTVVLALFLDARAGLRRFVREVLNEHEFWDTLRFLAVIFVILPVLPRGEFGPYGALNPRQIWIFVILVSSISYLGYFLQRFLGEQRGLGLTAVVGGVGSTTAATLAFARQVAERPERWRELGAATVLANAVLNPRMLVLLWLAGGPLLHAAVVPLAVMMAVGLGWAWWLGRQPHPESGEPSSTVRLGNPFHLTPALKFGLLFLGVGLVARWTAAEFGSGGVVVSSLLGGSVDVDAIGFSLAGLLRDGRAEAWVALAGLLMAIGANAVVKTAMAYATGGRRFGRVVLSGFVLMLGAGVACLWLPVRG